MFGNWQLGNEMSLSRNWVILMVSWAPLVMQAARRQGEFSARRVTDLAEFVDYTLARVAAAHVQDALDDFTATNRSRRILGYSIRLVAQ